MACFPIMHDGGGDHHGEWLIVVVVRAEHRSKVEGAYVRAQFARRRRLFLWWSSRIERPLRACMHDGHADAYGLS